MFLFLITLFITLIVFKFFDLKRPKIPFFNIVVCEQTKKK